MCDSAGREGGWVECAHALLVQQLELQQLLRHQLLLASQRPRPRQLLLLLLLLLELLLGQHGQGNLLLLSWRHGCQRALRLLPSQDSQGGHAAAAASRHRRLLLVLVLLLQKLLLLQLLQLLELVLLHGSQRSGGQAHLGRRCRCGRGCGWGCAGASCRADLLLQ